MYNNLVFLGCLKLSKLYHKEKYLVPCKERVGNLTCPEFAKICKKGYCLNENGNQ